MLYCGPRPGPGSGPQGTPSAITAEQAALCFLAMIQMTYQGCERVSIYDGQQVNMQAVRELICCILQDNIEDRETGLLNKQHVYVN